MHLQVWNQIMVTDTPIIVTIDTDYCVQISHHKSPAKTMMMHYPEKKAI